MWRTLATAATAQARFGYVAMLVAVAYLAGVLSASALSDRCSDNNGRGTYTVKTQP